MTHPLRIARERQHMTQALAAELIGVALQTYQRWETGKTRPYAVNIKTLCEVFGASAAELGFADNITECSNDQPVVIVPADIIMTEPLQSSLRQDLTARLMHIVLSHQGHQTHDLEALQSQINQEVRGYNAVVDEDLDSVITRRNALRSLVLLPLCLLPNPTSKLPVADILTQCTAGITACWYLKKGKELRLAFDAVSTYIATLQVVAQSSSTHRKTAIALILQCYLLKSCLARHLENNSQSIYWLQQAQQYSNESDDLILRVIIPRTLAATYYYLGQHWRQSGEMAQQSIDFVRSHKEIPQHVQSFVYAGSATYLSINGKYQEALRALKLAHQLFDDSDEALVNLTGHDRSNLIHNHAMTHFYLGKYQEAAVTMDGIAQSVYLTARAEHILDRAKIEVSRDDQTRDMDLCISLLRQGIEGAKEPYSEQRLIEARTIYSLLNAAWPGEQRIKELRDLFM